MSDYFIKIKSFNFAVKIVDKYKRLLLQNEFVLSKQLLRSGTSIGANVREAKNAESKADFIHKLGIAQKEADETLYWLELLYVTKYLSEEEFNNLNEDGTEILKLLKRVIITSKNNLKNK